MFGGWFILSARRVQNATRTSRRGGLLFHPKFKSSAMDFGTLLGTTDGGVEVFSCNYDTLPDEQWEDRSWFENQVDGTYTGFKWQCVELGRRYLLQNFGVAFDSIPMAYDIFRLRSVVRQSDNQRFKMIAFENGSKEELPVKGSLLIWNPVGEFKKTGHIAVIVNVTETYCDIVEQNVKDKMWAPGQNYSRRLNAVRGADGGYTISCSFSDTSILGWKTIKFDQPYNYEDFPNCTADHMKVRSVSLTDEQKVVKWLDPNVPHLQAYMRSNGPDLWPFTYSPKYFTITESAESAVHFATDNLHMLFLDATDFLLHHIKEYGKYFCIPEKLWPKIRRSWFRNRYDTVSGRLDFALTSEGMKVYEYNADSASCLLECGYLQDRWSDLAGIKEGRSCGDQLFTKLVTTWKNREVKGVLHLLCDNDVEEIYHTEYMKAAAEAAGIECRILIGFKELSWTDDGNLKDREGRIVKNVWKTWSWRTALNQLTDKEFLAFLDTEEEFEKNKGKIKRTGPVKLVDVLLHLEIRVFEPLWTLIPSSKAILPILSLLKPKHPYVLKSSFEVTPEMIESGYVSKPVTGRCGANISLFGPQDGGLIEKTEGRWEGDEFVYQELAILPKIDDSFVQLNAWLVDGEYAGMVNRADKSAIIVTDSAIDPLRVVPDE